LDGTLTGDIIFNGRQKQRDIDANSECAGE
jgi:hypothetical protein